jgi:hypothetical protein
MEQVRGAERNVDHAAALSKQNHGASRVMEHAEEWSK